MSDTDNNLPSEAQRDFAMKIAERLEIEIDENILINKDDLSEWIKEHNNLPSPKQIDLAEQIAEKIGDMRVLGDKKLIELIYHNKTVNDYDEKSKIYDITTKSTKKLDFDTRSLFNNYKSLNYNVNYSFSDKTIK